MPDPSPDLAVLNRIAHNLDVIASTDPSGWQVMLKTGPDSERVLHTAPTFVEALYWRDMLLASLLQAAA